MRRPAEACCTNDAYGAYASKVQGYSTEYEIEETWGSAGDVVFQLSFDLADFRLGVTLASWTKKRLRL